MASSENGNLQQNDAFVRPDLFHPASLTDEEAKLMKQLRFESAWHRGYPFAFLAGSATALLTKRFSVPSRLVLTAVSGIMGNVVGRISYLPTIHKRLLSDLPADSPLRQKLEVMKQNGPRGMNGRVEEPVQFEVETSQVEEAFSDSPKENATSQKKFVTYEELRRRNRNSELTNMRPKQSESETVDVVSSDLSTRNKRFNKYGDEIVDG